MLHGCRQLVFWDVGLISLTSETPWICCYLGGDLIHYFQKHSNSTAGDRLEEGRDHVKSSWPLWTGLHTCYIGEYNKLQWWKSERISKVHLSSDCSLQFENMKPESLVIADQHAAVNLYLSLVLTARHARKVECNGSLYGEEWKKLCVNTKVFVMFFKHNKYFLLFWNVPKLCLVIVAKS